MFAGRAKPELQDTHEAEGAISNESLISTSPPDQNVPVLATRFFMATILMVTVAITISTFYFATVQAESHGAITGLTLTSDAPGSPNGSPGTRPAPSPTDYRVDWAKSDEDYQSWKVDDGHVYPADTATTATIADLEHDTEYKIRMRARYYRGEHEGKVLGRTVGHRHHHGGRRTGSVAHTHAYAHTYP